MRDHPSPMDMLLRLLTGPWTTYLLWGPAPGWASALRGSQARRAR